MPYIGQDIVFKKAVALCSLLLFCILCWADNLVYLTFPALSPRRNTFPPSSNAMFLPLSYSTHLNLQVLFFPCLHPPLTHHLPTARLISRAGTPQLSSLLLHSSPPQPPSCLWPPGDPYKASQTAMSSLFLSPVTQLHTSFKQSNLLILLVCSVSFNLSQSSWLSKLPAYFFLPKLPRHLLLSRTP